MALFDDGFHKLLNRKMQRRGLIPVVSGHIFELAIEREIVASRKADYVFAAVEAKKPRNVPLYRLKVFGDDRKQLLRRVFEFVDNNVLNYSFLRIKIIYFEFLFRNKIRQRVGGGS